MTEVELDPRQAPARAELLLAADFGRQAPGRPIHRRLESEGNGAGDLGPRLKISAVRDAPARGDAARGRAAAGPRRPNGGRSADAVLDECGAVQALPRESVGDLARIDGVTPRTRSRSARSSPQPETIANPLGKRPMMPR